MVTYKICGKWLLEVGDYSEDKRDIHKRPYYQFLDNKLLDVGQELWCYEYLLKYISVESVVEYFGGIGCDALLIENMMQPKSHVLVDLDETCVNILKRNLPGATVVHGDFFDVAGEWEADLACLDFNSFTALQLWRNSNMQKILGYVLDSCSFVLITDTAVSHLHLNKERYSQCLDYEVMDLDSYVAGLSRILYNMYEFSIIKAASHKRATYLLATYVEAHPDPVAWAPLSARNYIELVK